ncbi:MAG: transaldolase [Verrucomicrobiae bacterium]|nr:transaldolase [Verrucomicrobiae bacterium]
MKANPLGSLRIKIFADGADLEGIRRLNADPLIKGMTTNPTLMRKSGVCDYEAFARAALEFVTQKPISFEVFADEFPEMRRQALKISAWQKNVYVKIPVTNTRGELALALIRDLAAEGVRVNVTAMLTPQQVEKVAGSLRKDLPSIVSVFAGRIADTGRDPVPVMAECLRLVKGLPSAELLWASVREALNIFQADRCGCHIVTVPNDILKKALQLQGMDLEALSLDTVRMFERDAREAGLRV